jgi:hypothetical protein
VQVLDEQPQLREVVTRGHHRSPREDHCHLYQALTQIIHVLDAEFARQRGYHCRQILLVALTDCRYGPGELRVAPPEPREVGPAAGEGRRRLSANGNQPGPLPRGAHHRALSANAGARFLLDHAITTAGCHPTSDIFLDDITVSRQHAQFRCVNAEFRVVDVGSLTGTYVNREPVDSAVLANGDEAQIGKFRLMFLSGPTTDGAESEAS